MKKIIALLLCFLLLCTCSVPVFAANDGDNDTVISVTVPNTHKITFSADDITVYHSNQIGKEFVVERLSSPTFLIVPKSTKLIKTVTVNGVDVTEQLKYGYLSFGPVYEDKVVELVLESRPNTPSKTHVIKVSANGATVSCDGKTGSSFIVEDASQPTLLISAESGKIIKSVTVNGKDVTDSLSDGYLKLNAVIEDITVNVITEDEPVETEETTAEDTTTEDPKPDDPKPDDPEPDETEPEETTPEDPTPDDPQLPNTHTLNITTDNAMVFYEGEHGEDFTVSEASEPRLLIRAESGKVIKSVTVDGEDVTSLLYGGYLRIGSVYKDKVIVVTTEDEPVIPEDTYTVTGRVTLNGKPLANVELELRSTLKTVTTDKNGYFEFLNVESGKHSLTAIGEAKVIGFLSFELQKDSESNVSLMDDGTYTVSIDQNGAGVELDLVLNEEDGTIAPTDVGTLRNKVNLLWLWILLIIVATCVVVFVIYRRKKAK